MLVGGKAPKGDLNAGFIASSAEGNLKGSFGCPESTSIPLLITGVVSLELDEAVVATAGVVLSLDAAVAGEGDFPFAVAPGGEVLALWFLGDRLETEAGLLLVPFSLVLLLLSGLPCSYGLKLTGFTESDTTSAGLLPLPPDLDSPDFSCSSLLLPVSAPICEHVCASNCRGDFPVFS